MKKRLVTLVLGILLFSQGIDTSSFADHAEVLPKGISRFSIDGSFYFPIDQQYDQDGQAEDVAANYNATLGSSVFGALSDLEAFLGLPAGSANIGRSIVSFEYDISIVEFTYQYGITSRLTAGITIPYWYVKNKVSAALDTSGATIGKSVALNSLVPIGTTTEETVPLTTEDVQNLLGEGLDIDGDDQVEVEGYGYDPVKTWSRSGLSDIKVGSRYQYFNTKSWRLAFTGGIKFPTGEEDDPDSIVDYALGSGAYTLFFHMNNDYLGIKNLSLNTTFRYNLILPTEETRRIPEDVDRPLTDRKEKVDRDIGDAIEVETSGSYNFSEGFSLFLLYKYAFQFKDDVSGSQGSDYEPLEDETDWTEQVGIIGLSYSTFPQFKAKKFPVPLVTSISYRNRFAGKNNTLKSQYVGLGLNVFF